MSNCRSVKYKSVAAVWKARFDGGSVPEHGVGRGRKEDGSSKTKLPCKEVADDVGRWPGWMPTHRTEQMSGGRMRLVGC